MDTNGGDCVASVVVDESSRCRFNDPARKLQFHSNWTSVSVLLSHLNVGFAYGRSIDVTALHPGCKSYCLSMSSFRCSLAFIPFFASFWYINDNGTKMNETVDRRTDGRTD